MKTDTVGTLFKYIKICSRYCSKKPNLMRKMHDLKCQNNLFKSYDVYLLVGRLFSMSLILFILNSNESTDRSNISVLFSIVPLLIDFESTLWNKIIPKNRKNRQLIIRSSLHSYTQLLKSVSLYIYFLVFRYMASDFFLLIYKCLFLFFWERQPMVNCQVYHACVYHNKLIRSRLRFSSHGLGFDTFVLRFVFLISYYSMSSKLSPHYVT